MPPSELTVHAVWKTTTTVELPDGMTPEQGREALAGGGLPEWLAEQLDTTTAELTDWEVSGRA